MEKKYKCEKHSLDFCCHGCVKARIARYDALLEFVKNICVDFTPGTVNDSWKDGYEHSRNQITKDALKVLKEIGEDDDGTRKRLFNST